MFLLFTELNDPAHCTRFSIILYMMYASVLCFDCKIILLMLFYNFVHFHCISKEVNKTTYIRYAQIINYFISLLFTKDCSSLYKQWLATILLIVLAFLECANTCIFIGINYSPQTFFLYGSFQTILSFEKINADSTIFKSTSCICNTVQYKAISKKINDQLKTSL